MSPREATSTPARTETVIALPGLEVDNLLAFMALLGLLRSLEAAKPDWKPRATWVGPPWEARLHLVAPVTQDAVAIEAAKGLARVAAGFEVGPHKNVKFAPEEFSSLASASARDPVRAALVAALSAEHPRKDDGDVRAAPLVLMFGQGHQNFLERLASVSRGELPPRFEKVKSPPDLRHPRYIAEALFEPWKREDDADAFRWDPEEDQRYALRFGDPSRAGAAPTAHGANRLAAVGFLSFPCVPRSKELRAQGALRMAQGMTFYWPVWTEPLSLNGIERMMSHPALSKGPVPALGVAEVYVARRIANGKFMNVTRAAPTPRVR